jgi:hypothetical protein
MGGRLGGKTHRSITSLAAKMNFQVTGNQFPAPSSVD